MIYSEKVRAKSMKDFTNDSIYSSTVNLSPIFASSKAVYHK